MKPTPKPYQCRFGDIPLESAMFAWNPKRYCDRPANGDGRFAVIPFPDEGDWIDRLKLSDSDGACWSYWPSFTSERRLLWTLGMALELASTGQCDAREIESGLMVIPEYRDFVRQLANKLSLALE